MLQSPFNDRVEGSRSTAAGKRPKLSLASLIGQAILATDSGRARLSTIYEWISERYPEYYRMNCGGWQNSIRHNLTINKAFIRLPKEDTDMPGKGAYWTIHPDYVHQFKDGIFTGKIRGSDYRSINKPRSKRNSLVDLPSQQTGFYYADPEFAHSNQSLVEVRHQEDYQQGPEDFGYHGPPPVLAANRAHYMVAPAFGPFAYVAAAPSPQAFYGMIQPPPNWQQHLGVVEQQHEPGCEYSCCSPPTQTTMGQIIDNSNVPCLPISYPPMVTASHFQPYYSSTANHEQEEMAMANIQGQFEGEKTDEAQQ